MGQQTKMSSSNGLQQSQQQQASQQTQQPPQQQAQHGKKTVQRSCYNAKAMAEIRDSLRPFEQQQKQMQESKIQHLVSLGYEEDTARRMCSQNNYCEEFTDLQTNGNSPPALPPRTRLKDITPIRISDNISDILNCNEIPPPPPPPRGNMNPPPTPPRGSTPPPVPLPCPTTASNQSAYSHIGNATTGANPPPLLRRFSPVPMSQAAKVTIGPAVTSNQITAQRGTSPISTVPLRVQNTREIQQQFQQTLQSMSIFPLESGAEPPPPYPMGAAAAPNPPPSYSQSLAMRQSPTLSSSSSDYRRSPGPFHSNVLSSYPLVPISPIVKNVCNTPTSPIPSPASSMMSTSSRTSSVQAWSSRQAKTHSPIIMQSVKSTHVQKPILQTAVAVASSTGENPLAPHIGIETEGTVGDKNMPPPSYEFSMQQKHLPSSSTSTTSGLISNPSPTPGSSNGQRIPCKLPPPPPYPSTKVPLKEADSNLVSASQVSTKMGPLVISTAKVISNRSENKQSLPGAFSVLDSEQSSLISASRSESPVSDSVSTSVISSLGLQSYSKTDPATDSGVGSDSQLLCKTTRHMSPKPERKQLSPEKEETRRESLIRNCPSQAYKFFMEQRIENVIKEYEQRRQRRQTLEQELIQFGVEDPLCCEQMRMVLRRKETNYLRMKRAKLNKKHFKRIKKIGVGAFGEVSLVRSINSVGGKSSGLYAMKTLKKSHVIEKNQVAHVIAEKDILAEADNDWIVKLYYSFQDKDHLYFVMEYIPGGDLMNLLIKLQMFSEDLARFYIAELTCAVESVHDMGFIHRDIKPDNILIDADGHIKLTDFGLCTGFRWTHNSKYYTKNGASHCRQDSMDPGTLDLESGRCSCAAISSSGMKPLERRKQQQLQRCLAHSLVGTPNYIAPEVLYRDGHGYTQSCDWWSVGVILYEMIIGQPPFHADNNPALTQRKILHWSEYLKIPPKPRITNDAENLIRGLITSADRRLGGKNGSQDIKSHPFFRGIDFSKPLRKQRAPYRPEIQHALDTSNFDPLDEEIIENEDGYDDKADGQRLLSRDYHGFYEFTFRRFFNDGDHSLTMREPSSSQVLNGSAPDPVYV